jgi:hypothetical protein
MSSAALATVPDTYPTDYVSKPVTAPMGMVEVDADIGISLTKELVGKPITISPDIWYGVSDALTVGLTHGFPYNKGICVAGKKDGVDVGCGDHAYNGLGVEALFDLFRSESFDLAAHGGIQIPQFSDDLFLGLNLGVKGKFVADKVGVFFDPQLYIGLNHRDATASSGENKEAIYIPVQIGYQVSPALMAYLDVEMAGPTSHFGDNYIGRLGVGAIFALTHAMDVGGQFTFDNLWGKQFDGPGAPGRADFRTLLLFAKLRF